MKKAKGTTQKAEGINIERKMLGGSLVPIFRYLFKNSARAGLSVPSPSSAQANTLRAFHSYPYRIIRSIFDIRSDSYRNSTFDIHSRTIPLARQVFATFILLFTLTLSKTQAQSLSLDSILSVIDKNNPMLQEYDNKINAWNEYASGSKSWMAPMVGAGTFMTPYSVQPPDHNGVTERGWLMFSVEQEIPNPAKLNANKNYIESRAGIEEQGRSIRYNTLRAEARTYYYQYLVSLKKLKVLEENTKIIDLMLKLARIRYPYNQGSLGNIYKTEGRQSEVQNMIFMTKGDAEYSLSRLKALMNLPATDSIKIDTAMVVTFKPEVQRDTMYLSQQRSDVKQINETIEAMKLNQQLQKYRAKPDFKIRFDHMQSLGDMPAQFTAMAMISIPIAPWSSKMYKAEVRGMQYDIEAMKKGREAILIETSGMLAGMANQLTRMEQQLKNYESKIIPALKKNYQTLMLAYEENREQLPMVIDGWEAMNMAEMESLNKLEEYYKMIVAYEKEAEN